MKRNYGIDFLRLVSMVMVTVLHVLGQGGLLYATEPGSLKYWVVWSIEIACYCAVNCFALISGYGMSQSQYRISRMCKIWLQAVFYSLLGLVSFLCFMPETVGKRDILFTVLPITSGQYWYISAYFGVLALTPLLNAAIAHTEKRAFGVALVTAFGALCVIPVVLQEDPFKLVNGYSLMWLCLLYLAGGYMRKYDVLRKIKSSYAWVTVLSMIAVTVLSKFVMEQYFEGIHFIYSRRHAFISYISPTLVLTAIGLFVVCSKLHFTERFARVIRFLSPAALGVYLSHSSPLIWRHLMRGFSESYAGYSFFHMIALIFSAVLLIFTTGIVLDLLRIRLFALLKIDKLCTRLDEMLMKKGSKVS